MTTRSLRLAAILSTIVVGAVATAGCSTEEPTLEEAEGNLTPQNPASVFDQAETCNAIFEDKKAFREPDLKDGLLRWKCGDVKGVTINRDASGKLFVNPESRKISDLGQEYCEYHAVVDGKIVDFAEDLKALPPTAKLSCVFTGVYFDVVHDANPSVMIQKSNAKAKEMAVDVAKWLGAATIDPKAVKMQDGVNSRGAASQLIHDCQNIAAVKNVDAERQAACFMLASKSGQVDKSIADLCRGVDLAKEANWAKVVAKGAKILTEADDATAFERQKDLTACAATFPLANRGQLVPWRNSDPTICARALRAAADCGDKFPPMDDVTGLGALPPAVEGFTMTGWEGRRLPDGCKRAIVGGKESDQIVICEVSQQKVKEAIENIEVAPIDPQVDFCHALFANNIAMQAPIRAVLASKGPGASAFCSAFNGSETR
jgi:hypothetical protein